MTTHPVFLPGKSHGQRSLPGYSPWDHTELDTTARTRAWGTGQGNGRQRCASLASATASPKAEFTQQQAEESDQVTWKASLCPQGCDSNTVYRINALPISISMAA